MKYENAWPKGICLLNWRISSTNWHPTEIGPMSFLMAMSGFLGGSRQIGARTGKDDGCGPLSVDGRGSLTNLGVGQPSTMAAGTGVSDSVGTGYRPPCGDQVGCTGTVATTTSAGHPLVLQDVLAS